MNFIGSAGFMWCYIMVLLAGSPAARPEHKKFVAGMAKIIPVKRQKIVFFAAATVCGLLGWIRLQSILR